MKVETVEEYIARGGVVQRCQPAGFPKSGQTVHMRNPGGKGELYVIEKPQRRSVEQKLLQSIDTSSLPPDLLDKLAEIV